MKHIVMINRTRPQTCDRKVKLYNLEPQKNWDRRQNCTNTLRWVYLYLVLFHRAFLNNLKIIDSIIKPIPHTNLLLVIANAKEEENPPNQMTTDPVKIKYEMYSSPVCYKVSAVLSRRRPSSCSKNAKDVSMNQKYNLYFFLLSLSIVIDKSGKLITNN